MINQQSPAERAKYHAILALSRQQAEALESDDFAAFQAILATKGRLIATLENAGRLAELDTSFADLVRRIRGSEQHAERLLAGKLGETKERLNELRERKTASFAYRKSDRSRMLAPIAAVADTPRLFDLHS